MSARSTLLPVVLAASTVKEAGKDKGEERGGKVWENNNRHAKQAIWYLEGGNRRRTPDVQQNDIRLNSEE